MLTDNSVERWKRWRVVSAIEELGDRDVAVRWLEVLKEAELYPLIRGRMMSALAQLKASLSSTPT